MPTYEGTILDTGGAVFNVRSSTFGALGNGVADDTAAIQAAVNAAAPGRGTVLIPPGTYMVTTITLAPGITIEGYGATLKRPPNQGKWTRTLNAPESGAGSYSSDYDSGLLTIRGLTLDANSANQGPYRGYELEQAHLIFLSADPAKAGRLRVSLEDLVLRNGVADGVSVYRNVELQMSNCRADDCFRGGLTVTGGYSVVQVQNLITTGRVDRTGIDVEVDGPGFGGSMAVDLTLNGLELDGDFDVAVYNGSRVVATDVVCGTGFSLYALDSLVRISDSTFRLGNLSMESRIVYPHDVTFQNCVFEVAGVTSVDGIDAAGANVYWNVSGSRKGGQRLRFLDCDFRVAPGVPAGLDLVGILVRPDELPLDNRLIVEGGSISSGFKYGLWMDQGGRWIIKETEIEAATGFTWTGVVAWGAQWLADMRIERVVFRGTTYMNIVTNDAGNVVDHRDTVLDEAQNVLATTYGIGGNVYRGGRLIRVVSDPTSRSVPGLRGDRARLASPAAGQPYEWVCTASSTTAATWKQVAVLVA
jgi:hypothetical protein